ncbi:MAG: PIN domain-containing protein [Rhodomicrobium sp.]
MTVFLDTNILLYSISDDPADNKKRNIALELLDRDEIGLSIQVFQEFYVQATRQSRTKPLTHAMAAGLISKWCRFAVQPMTLDILNAALDIKQRHRLSYWDSAIVAAALALGCHELYTEDMQDGLRIDGLRLINPFL